LTVAALYVDRRGPYFGLLGEALCWAVDRDATKYEGPWPIVAHPACGPWGKLRHMYKGGEGGPELAIKAVDQVRQWGGVLEHPAHSRLWAHCNLPRPGEPTDEHGGYTVAIHQCDWGHVARKATWLYCVRVDREVAEWQPPKREPTHWISGGRGTPGKRASQCCPPGIKICSERQRKVTPPDLADYLIFMAGTAQ
jgi:hypothetical protein